MLQKGEFFETSPMVVLPYHMKERARKNSFVFVVLNLIVLLCVLILLRPLRPGQRGLVIADKNEDQPYLLFQIQVLTDLDEKHWYQKEALRPSKQPR
jgi:Na+/proline symporter